MLDNLSTGRIENIRHLLARKDFVFKKGSVLNKTLVKKIAAEVNEIYHLAAAVGVRTVMENPLESFIVNSHGTEIVLEAAEAGKISVLLASTSEVYGKTTKVPFGEEDDRVYGSVYNYRWGYAYSKGLDEFLGLAYFREKGVPVRIVRFFNTIGPRQLGEYGMVVPTFVRKALSGESLLVHGDGRQMRAFGYVGDVVDAVVKIMAHPKSVGKVYNLGSQEEISILDLAKKVIKLTGSSSKIILVSHKRVYKEGFEDMARRVPDISKIKKLIGYKPKHTLEESIKEIIKYESN